MKRRQQLGAAVIEYAPAQTRNGFLGAQERLRRELPKRDDDFRLDDVDLLKQKRLACLDLVGLGIAVLGWSALDDVRDINVLARQLDRLDDLRQQLPRPSDKRHALHVFVRTRRFTDEHEIGIGVAPAKHDLGSPKRMQLAARALPNLHADGRQVSNDNQRSPLGLGFGRHSGA